MPTEMLAYCCESFADVTRRAAGVEPLTCPPLAAESFQPEWLEGRRLLYFDLHGDPGAACWRGDGGIVALRAQQVRSADLAGATVVALNCFLADEGSPMLDALLEAGAGYVIGGEGRNWAGQRELYGAGTLGLWVRRWLDLGVGPLRALALAKQRVALALRFARLVGRTEQAAAYEDALAFRAFYREQEREVV